MNSTTNTSMTEQQWNEAEAKYFKRCQPRENTEARDAQQRIRHWFRVGREAALAGNTEGAANALAILRYRGAIE